MAATQGLPLRFYDDLKQSVSSKEGILCFLAELDVSIVFKDPESVLRDLEAASGESRLCLELVLASKFLHLIHARTLTAFSWPLGRCSW